MFDPFRKEEIRNLREKIAELEEENSKLSLQLEKRDEKTKKALTTKQEAEREINEAQKRISTLEGELEKLKGETKNDLNFRFSVNFTGNRFEDVLFLLDSMRSKLSTLITIYLGKDRTLENMPKDVFDLMESSSISHIEKINSSTGKVIFYDADNIVRLVILPVFPIIDTEYVLDRQYKTGPLKDRLHGEKILVINAHAGETFIGIMEPGAFIEHELIRSSVMGKHSKGGWSQKRFQSLVEEDIKHHADKVRDALCPIIEKNRDIQYVFAGGEGRLIKMILEGYEYPVVSKSIDPQALNPQQVLKEIMSVRLYGL